MEQKMPIKSDERDLSNFIQMNSKLLFLWIENQKLTVGLWGKYLNFYLGVYRFCSGDKKYGLLVIF